jgi:acyl-coenzyme A thioesterase PaaI-like protein
MMATRTTMPPPPVDFPSADEHTRYRAMLDSIIDGTAANPPYVRRLALPRPTRWSYGRLDALLEIGADVTWNSGAVFGGYITCLTDLYAGLAMLTVLPDTARFLTGHIAVSFRAPLVPGRVSIVATVTELLAHKAATKVVIRQSGRITSTGLVTQVISST